ncbi:hypothetical protein TCAL_11109 [Tigriopus californicus]|uniref:Innexin n=1 Tax=Tigriopus californicus TaxID=6832 RepID=A0A553PDK2_TIGCA|nr:innexin shaking-B-like [Tigriopus californicus]TRY75746.1 hypothetical protein TCAL_11109 [Tigriopus californicus]|eukprot:TCALIF_11109-PA protein Name:"Similar to Inx2 Innexin inx2 (Drosophila melanogaster)" AED:0.02 eAED:0.02 QI:94/1/1/1/0.8/0.83/6/102/378
MSLVDSLKDIHLSILPQDPVKIDTFVFRLHYFWTVSFILVFSVLLSLSQYAGDPIDCIHDHNIPDDTFDRFCWVEGTWTRKLGFDAIGGQMDKAFLRKDLNFVRCFDESTNSDGKPHEDCWQHQYYQWVALVLVLQAGCFYFPRYLWQIWEQGKIQSLVSGLDRTSLIKGLQSKNELQKGEIKDKIQLMIQYWREAKGTNNLWAIKFYICELLCVLNVVAQFYFTNFFLNGQFAQVARQGLNLDENDSILPILAECRLTTYGSGGQPQLTSGLCVLPLNIVNQKFYSLYWYWLSALLVVSILALTLRILQITSHDMKKFVIVYFYRIKEFNDVILKRSNHGDWFLLIRLMDNMNDVVSSLFLDELEKIKPFEAYRADE